MVRESTRQSNQNTARQMEAAHRASLAKGEVGIRDRKEIPILKNFCIERVEPWAKSTFEQASPKTWLWYGFGIDSLKKSRTLANLNLNEIGPELVAEYASERQREGLQISSVNSCLRALRRVLRLAVEWGVLDASPKVKFLAGEHRPRKKVYTSRQLCRSCMMFPWSFSTRACARKNVTASNGRTSTGMRAGTECS